MDFGYIKLFRSLTSWRWYKDGNTMRVFLHLLLNANITDADFETETIKRGELVTSIKKLSAELTLSPQAIRTAINHLILTSEITKRTTSKFTIITIKNYDKFQGLTSPSTSEQQASNKQVTSEQQQYKKNKKKKKNKNIYTRGRARESKASYDIEELMSFDDLSNEPSYDIKELMVIK